jgi:hypothetical protein
VAVTYMDRCLGGAIVDFAIIGRRLARDQEDGAGFAPNGRIAGRLNLQEGDASGRMRGLFCLGRDRMVSVCSCDDGAMQ